MSSHFADCCPQYYPSVRKLIFYTVPDVCEMRRKRNTKMSYNTQCLLARFASVFEKKKEEEEEKEEVEEESESAPSVARYRVPTIHAL